ncbi:MAG: DUF2844 domain-containing protein [Gammaproteobacteria bacterium]
MSDYNSAEVRSNPNIRAASLTRMPFVQRCTVLLILLLFSPVTLATLGQPASTALNDGTPRIQARQLLGTNGAQVQDQFIVTATGVAVHEFSAGGIIFAIRWSGTTMPDLSRLLGGFFPQYRAAVKARRLGRRRSPTNLHRSQLVVHSGGHMRDYYGSAYVPDLVPAGIDLQSLGVQP